MFVGRLMSMAWRPTRFPQSRAHTRNASIFGLEMMGLALHIHLGLYGMVGLHHQQDEADVLVERQTLDAHGIRQATGKK